MIARRRFSAVVFAILVLLPMAVQAVNPFGRNGFNLTDGDIAILTDTTRPFFDDDTIPLGTVKSWTNPKSGNGGTATLVERFEQKGLPCRRIQHDIKLKKMGDPFRFIIDRCRVADGSWKML